MSAVAATVARAPVRPLEHSAAPTVTLDPESREWLRDLRAEGATRAAAVERLHALLLRAARFEVARRRPALPNLRGNELDEIALEAADDALDGCPACREEHESLRALVGGEQAL